MRRKLTAVLALLTALAGSAPFSSPAGDPSPEYRESLRRTLELRKARRRTEAPAPVGTIVPYPMPPVLVIRHTRQTHDDIGALLDLLRYGGR